ncbi:unannotated protein [freshwater metagenome]|uniref:Unannotated protein n=1 Tax=freshwater metagenome TaxID=449393 RepID=A0A6J6FCY3_9ZZZZ
MFDHRRRISDTHQDPARHGVQDGSGAGDQVAQPVWRVHTNRSQNGQIGGVERFGSLVGSADHPRPRGDVGFQFRAAHGVHPLAFHLRQRVIPRGFVASGDGLVIHVKGGTTDALHPRSQNRESLHAFHVLRRPTDQILVLHTGAFERIGRPHLTQTGRHAHHRTRASDARESHLTGGELVAFGPWDTDSEREGQHHVRTTGPDEFDRLEQLPHRQHRVGVAVHANGCIDRTRHLVDDPIGVKRMIR